MNFSDLPIDIQELILTSNDSPAVIIEMLETPSSIFFDEQVVDVVDNSFDHEFGTELVLDYECRFDESDIENWRSNFR